MNKNKKQLESFTTYCELHPSERFWQALRNWSESPFILKAEGINLVEKETKFTGIKDTFYEN